MKKFFSLILVAMLSLSPIYAFATEDAQALTPTTSETPTEAAAETPAPEVSTEAPAAEAPASEVPAQGSVTDGDSIAETPSSEQLNTDTSTDATSDESEKTEEESSDTKTDDKKTDEKVDGEATEDTEETDLEKDSEEELDEELEEEEEEEKDKTSIPEHEHEFEYISNKDGTHIVKCIAPVIQEKEDGEEGETEEVPCDYEVVEECSYDEEGVCIYCEYVKPKEEPKFEPTVTITIENSSCRIGETNPVICMNISVEDFDVAYAQVCFANYGENKFINLGLSQGKYYNYKDNTFVHTENSNWYASPDITYDYAPGKYTIRSLFIRSTTGEAVHYSVESGNLAEGYENYSIELASPTAMSLIKDVVNSSNNEKPASEEPAPGADVFIETEDLEAMVEEAPIGEESSEEEKPATEETPVTDSTTNEAPVLGNQPVVEEQPSNGSGTVVEEPNQNETTLSTPQTEEKSTEVPKAGESKGAETTPPSTEPALEESPKTEEPKATDTPKSNNNTRSNTDNNSNTKQDNTSNTTSNTILNFFKKLFGLK